MTDRPILFSAPMVRAILDGRKTQTRRVVKSPWKKREIVNLRSFYNDNGNSWSGEFDDPHNWGIPNVIDQDPLSVYDMACKYGSRGDRLWVRETFGCLGRSPKDGAPSDSEKSTTCYKATDRVPEHIIKWRPSIHMPRWASRITLEITNVRVERLQDISEADSIDEGVPADSDAEPQDIYMSIWNELNGPASWFSNPWVWVIEFKRVQP